jgi:FixJ family two-component response regulator
VLNDDMTNVIVLDDDQDIRVMLCEIFRLLGAKSCSEFGSVEELKEQPDVSVGSDLAILDVNLGAGVPSGTDACQWLLEHGYRGKIVFLTGHAKTHPMVKKAAQTGAQVLEKPTSVGVLADLLSRGHA